MATNIEQQWADIGLKQSMDYTPDAIETNNETNTLGTTLGNTIDTTGTAISLTDRFNKLEELSREKANKLTEASESKNNKLNGYEDVTIVGISDADTYRLADGRTVRVSDPIYRYDAAEVEHPQTTWQSIKSTFGFGNNEKSDYASQTQKEMVGRVLGKGPNIVTDKDIYSVGNMQQIQVLSDLSMNKGDERWTAQVEPGAEQVNLNSGLNIGAKIKVTGKDAYGRVLADVVNPRTEENVTRLHAQDSRLNAFAPGYKTIGKEFDANGNMIDTVDRDGMIGEAIDIGQSSLIKQYAGTVDALDEGVRWLANKVGIEPESFEKYFPKDYKIGLVGDGKYTAKQLARDDTTSDKLAGVMASTREDQQKSMETAKKNLIDGDYVGAAGEVMSTLPYMLGDSAGEMGAIMLGTPGIISAIGNRINNDAEDYKKNNEGKEPDANWILGSTLLNSAALFGEKFLLKSGISSIIEKGLSKAGRTGAVAQSTVGETAQEWFDQTQQMYMTQKEGQRTAGEIATSPDAVLAALSGGIMGGALSGAGHVVGSAKDKILPAAKNGIDASKSGINNVSDKIKSAKVNAENVVDDANAVVDENERAVHDTNFTDAETRLSELHPLALKEDASNEEYMNGFIEVNAIRKQITDAMKSGTIDKKRSDEAIARLKDINDKMSASVTKIIGSGDEQAMTTLFSDPTTAESNFRQIANSGSDDLDLDGANFMKAGYSAGLDDETITDIKDEAKAVRQLRTGTGKSIDKVANEVSNEARGYLTYKDTVDEGIESNDINKINNGITQMESFFSTHSAKLDVLNSGIANAEEKVSKIVKEFADSRKISIEDALIKLEKLSGQTKVTYPRGQTGTINNSDIVKQMIDPSSNSGIYGIRNAVKNEVDSMQKVIELTQKRVNAIGSFTKQFDTNTEVDYEDEIKQLEPEVVKLRDKVAKYKLVDKEDLNEKVVSANIEKLKSMEAKLKAAKNKLAKIKGTKVDSENETAKTTESSSTVKTPGSNSEEPTYNDKEVSSIIDPINPPADVVYEEPKYEEPKIKEPIVTNDDFDGIDTSVLNPIDISDMSKYPIDGFNGNNPIVMNINYDDPIDAFANYKEPSDEEISAFLNTQSEPEYKDYADINVDNIANFESIDDIKDGTDEEKTKKSEIIKQLEAELIKAKESLSKVKEIYNALKNKLNGHYAEKQEIYERNSGNKQWNEKDIDRMEWLNNQTESAKTLMPKFVSDVINKKRDFVNGITAKLSGSAEIESIIKDTGLGAIVSEKTKMIKKDKDGNDKYQIIKSSKIVKGNKKASNRLSGMKIKDITDNKTVLDYADSAVETLSNVVDKVEKKYNNFNKVIESDKVLPDVNGLESGLKEVQKLRDSLFRGILFNADGSINKNVATAIAMTGDEYRALMASKLAFNTKEDIAKMLGITEGEVTGLMTRTMTFNGSFKKLIADDLSTTLFKNLAISGVDTADKELVAKMEADAGQIVLLYMQEKGYIEPLATSTMTVKQYETMMEKDEGFAKEMFTEFGESENGATIPMVRLAGTRDANGNQIRLKGKAKEAYDKTFSKETEKITKTLDVLGSTFGIESTKKGYKTKPTKTESKKVKNSKVNNMSDEALETINVSQAEAFEMNGGVEVLFELDKNGNRLIDDATILKAMGYKTEAELEGKSPNTVESAEARNMEIINNLDELKSLRARVLDHEDEMTNEMYFDYFFGKNGRFYMDSVGINPQTEKQLHRWLITPRAHKTTIDMKSEDDKDIKKVKMFKLAIAQAFGFAIDKKANAKAYALAEAIMAADESELLKVLKPNSKGKFEHTFTGSYGKSHTLEIEHIGHTMQAISALRDYRASGGTKFETTMSIEFDAVTSGFIIKLMQLPILKDMKQVKAWLAKGGVFLGGQDGITIGDEQSFNPDTWDKLKSMSDIIDNNWITDAYRTLAGKMKTPEKVDDKFYSNGKNNVFANNLLASMIPMLGEIKDIDEQVTKEGRALFKDPFMTFNYAAGMASIKRSLGYNMTESFADEMLDKESAKGNALITALHGRELNAKELSDFREQLLTKDFDEVVISEKGERDVKVSELMRKIIEDAYGTQVENILNDEFGPLVKANTIINNSFKGVFLAWKKAYEAEVAKVKKEGRVLSAKVEDEILLALKEKFPMINAPLSSGKIEDLETVAIYSTKLQNGKDKTYGAAKTYINKTVSENNPKGQQTLTVQSMIREFDAAMSAGAVIPIHYIDGSFITRVLRASGILGVHDAIVVGIDGAFQAVKDYNKNVYENSRDYSVIEELHKLVSRNIKGNEDIVVIEAKGKNPAVTFSKIFNELTNLNYKVKERRKILFNTDVKVMHMTAIDDTDYSEIDGQGTVKKANEIVEYVEPEVKETTDKKSDSAKTPGSEKQDPNKLYKGKDGKIKFGDGKWTRQVNSFKELFDLSSQFDSLLQGTYGVLKKENGGYEYLKEIEKMIKNSGVKFNPVQINFEYNDLSKANKVGMGLHKPTGGKDGKPKIELFYNGVYESNKNFLDSKYPANINIESPVRVVLHEYVHALTVSALRSSQPLMASAIKLRNHAAQQLGIKDAKKFYGIVGDVLNSGMEIENIKMSNIEKSDPFEFIAELITNPSLQTILGKLPSISNEKSSILDDVKKVFNAIVKFVSNRVDNIEEVNALTDGLEIVYKLFDAKVNSEPDVGNSTDDIGLINNALDIMKILKNEYISNAKQQKDRTSDDYKDLSSLATDFAKIEKMIEGCK